METNDLTTRILEKLQGGFADLKSDFKELKTEVADLRSELKSDIADLRSGVAGLQADVTELKSDVTGLKADVTELRSDVTGLKSDVTELKSDVTELKSDVAGLKSDVTELKSNVACIHKKMKTLVTRGQFNQAIIMLDRRMGRLHTWMAKSDLRSSNSEYDTRNRMDKLMGYIDAQAALENRIERCEHDIVD